MKNSSNKALVIFGREISLKHLDIKNVEVVIAHKVFQQEIESSGRKFIEIDSLIGPGSVHEAATLLEELPLLKSVDGISITKVVIYKGYELWWMHYNNLFYNFCIPYTKYQKLLSYLKNFSYVSFYQTPYPSLFRSYFESHGCSIYIFKEVSFKKYIHAGTLIQLVWTMCSLPVLMVLRHKVSIFVGDKFEKRQDYDFRMGFIYKELRARKIGFMEFVRSLESWKVTFHHIVIRRRPVIYSEAVNLLGKYLAAITRQRYQTKNKISSLVPALNSDPEIAFKFSLAKHYLFQVDTDIWAIEIMKIVQKLIGLRVAIFTAALERNFATVLACKLNNIQTVGILHGMASRYSTPYDYMTGFNGTKFLSLDSYGVWSNWWKEHYEKYSHTYKADQIFVSGPMRPIVGNPVSTLKTPSRDEKVRVLFVAEQTAAPSEVLPYLETLIADHSINLTIKFRPFRDGFEDWLSEHKPGVLENVQIVKGNMQDAIKDNDVVVGCHSTGVLEALLQLKVPIFLYTHKWGDYYTMGQSVDREFFIVSNSQELIKRIHALDQVSVSQLTQLREQYFGDPHKNGSAWVVDKVEELLAKT